MDFTKVRMEMVQNQLESRGIKNSEILNAFRSVPREDFVPVNQQKSSYYDGPVPIGNGQTISQPYIVALTIETADLKPGQRVLEIGTGCGYQTAILAALGLEVYSIERIAGFVPTALSRLLKLGYSQCNIRAGDGFQGWPEHAPFDAIILSAAPEKIPEHLLQQLKEGGVLVGPAGGSDETQWLYKITRTPQGFNETRICPVSFVPMLHGSV